MKGYVLAVSLFCYLSVVLCQSITDTCRQNFVVTHNQQTCLTITNDCNLLACSDQRNLCSLLDSINVRLQRLENQTCTPATVTPCNRILYATTSGPETNTLQSVDTTTRTLASNIVLDMSYVDIAFNPSGNLFGISQFMDTAQTLNRINVQTGVSTVIGPTTVSNLPGSTEMDIITGLVFSPTGVLYAAGNFFYTVNTLTGATTQVGAELPEACVGDLAYYRNVLYMTAANNLYSINTATGAATQVVALANNDYLGLSVVCDTSAGTGADNLVLLAVRANGDVIQVIPSATTTATPKDYGVLFQVGVLDSAYGAAVPNEAGFTGTPT